MNFNEVNDKLTNSKHGGGSLNNKNNASSRKYAIVFGIFALVIVTTAASFAFFTYSRTGQTTTTITSGDIEFSFIEGTNAFLTDAFPVSDSVGATDATGEYTFDVKMSSSSTNNKMTYNVYLLDDNSKIQDDEGNTINYFDNEQIEFALIKNGTYVANTSSTTGKKLTEVTGFTSGEHNGEGLVLANQEIMANSKDTYKLRIWISDDVDYSNTIDENGTMTGKFNGYKYSLKVKVTSGVETTTTVSEPVGRVIVANLADSNGVSAYAVTQSQDSSTVTDWIDVTDDTAKSNVVRTATSKVTSKNIQHKVDSYGTYYLHVKNTLNEITTKKIDVKIKEVAKDTSGAATPVIKGNLVPVIMNGSDVIKADTTKGWYNYDQAIWANAVILEDNAGTYNVGDIILEEAIESYFVWIPRYEYKIFDKNVGNYTDVLTEKGDATQEIEIKFVTKNDQVKNGEIYGSWLTHPAFTSFDSNGMWVGKFESGYKGATKTLEAENNINDSSKLIIKPNVYSWRSIQVANAHQTSFNYERELDSHMMKNTEWGAVAYLSHSKYGAKDAAGNGVSIRINNNKAYITGYSSSEEPTQGYNSGTSIEGNRLDETLPMKDGNYTLNYSNLKSVLSSTTGNYSGIYDMSGGAYEYVMSVMLDINDKPLSGRHNLYNSGFKGNYSCPTCDSTTAGVDSIISTNTTGIAFPEDTKYFDTYSNSAVANKYNTRILGDATGEMGSFYTATGLDKSKKYHSGWYDDYSVFVNSSNPWFHRGGGWYEGNGTGIFAFGNRSGYLSTYYSFRVVLTP